MRLKMKIIPGVGPGFTRFGLSLVSDGGGLVEKSYVSPLLSRITLNLIVIVLALLAALSLPCSSLAREADRDTFSISLVQEATVKKIKGEGAAYERYTVKKGDYLCKILRDKGLIPGPDIKELLSAIKGMNKSLTNLDLIHPGQTILIPLKLVPEKRYRSEVDDFFQKSVMGFSSLEDVSLENYVVKPGDSLTKVVMSKYKIPPDYLYNEYLELVQKFNPTMKDPDLIYPNQTIRLPIYSPEIVKMPIKKTHRPKPKRKIALKKTEPVVTSPVQKPPKTLSLSRELKDVFDQIGEEWVDSGEQFIPLKSGGHVNLKAESFPTLNLRNGRMLIIDIGNELPEEITRLIESDWQTYKVVHLAPHDNLKASLDKILAACAYHEVLGSGERLKIRSDIDITLGGDWVIIPQKTTGDTPERIVSLALIGNQTERTPMVVRTYLEKLGIRVIEYPDFPAPPKAEEELPAKKVISLEKGNPFPLPTMLLDLAGQSFSSEVKIPVYQGGGTGFNLIIHADLFFNRAGNDCIIDTTGLSPDIIELLKKHQFRVLTLAGEKDPRKVTEAVLDFLELEFYSKPHEFLVSSRDKARNITLTVHGISFSDKNSRKILATDRTLPREVVAFLNQRGYHLLELGQLDGR
ncbi:MAG: LysM peptidoglycan-binding domain-containing protein [Deltaproteobacteria bacterium]|nr:LysM peptidoglycan-binding domain-containing protein [Deltaproteobacteria bacterium]